MSCAASATASENHDTWQKLGLASAPPSWLRSELVASRRSSKRLQESRESVSRPITRPERRIMSVRPCTKTGCSSTERADSAHTACHRNPGAPPPTTVGELFEPARCSWFWWALSVEVSEPPRMVFINSLSSGRSTRGSLAPCTSADTADTAEPCGPGQLSKLGTSGVFSGALSGALSGVDAPARLPERLPERLDGTPRALRVLEVRLDGAKLDEAKLEVPDPLPAEAAPMLADP
mmetsp:Transcript_17239/g.39756  ORF Transcript_17239/g.39756 Transcript_17239/m.39756 type:complete len:235 (+) Transcript_17239:200-904(+)